MNLDTKDDPGFDEYTTCKTCGLDFPKTLMLRHINNTKTCKDDHTNEDYQNVRALSKDFQRRKRNERDRANYNKEKRAQKHKENYDADKRAQNHKERYNSEKRKSRYNPQNHKNSYNPEQRRGKYQSKKDESTTRSKAGMVDRDEKLRRAIHDNSFKMK